MSHIIVERNDVLGTSPADHVEKVSQYLETSVGHNKQDETSHAPAEAESDSGDSLFLTQAPAPEAVRLKRRHRGSLRSKPISPRDLEESEDDAASSSSSSAFGEEPEADKRKRRRRRLQLPEFTFPFLTGRSRAQQNRVLHNSTMAGFFKCVREMCPDSYREVDLFSTLPTVDMDGENISPLSEEEDDWSESEDIKIVERRCFIVSSKTKHPQPWYVPEEGDGAVEQQRIEGTGTPRRGRRRKTAAKASTSRVTAPSSDTESCHGRRSRKVLAANEKNDKHATSDKSSLVQPETPRTKRWLARANNKALVQEEEKNKDHSTDSDDTFCETLETQRSPGKSTPTCREASNVTELHANVFHTDDLSQTGEVEDEPESQSLIQSLPGFVSDINTGATDSESTRKKKEPSSLTAPHMDDELELNEDACAENSLHDDITLIQEKTLLSDSDTVNVTQEDGGNLETEERLEEDSVFSMTSESMNSGQEKKKKKKKKRERGDEEIQTNTVSKLLNNDAETPKKKKKMKKQKEVGAEVGVDLSSSNDVTLKESTGQSGEKMKKKKRKGISEGVDVSCTPDKNENVNNSESSQKTKEGGGEQDEVMTKKKKKKKKRESISEVIGISCTLDRIISNTDCSQKTMEGPGEEDEPLTKKKKKKKRESIPEVGVLCTVDESENISNVDCYQKIKEVTYKQDELVTKKKKKKSEIFCTNVSEDTVTQSDELVSVQKKEKRRTSSFLIADAEEKVAQTPEEQSSPRSNSVAADFETESAETPGNLGLSHDGVGKKKRKRKRKESVVQENDEEQGFGETNKTCQSTLSKTTDTNIKKKKKRKKEDGELVTPVEKLDNSVDVGYSQTDEAVVLKKKKKKNKKIKDVPDHVTPESPPTTADAEPEGGSVETCSSVSHKKRDKQSKRHSADVSPAGCNSEKAIKAKLNKDEQASPSADTPATLNQVRDKKKKKKRKAVDFQSTAVPINQTSPTRVEMSFKDSVVKNKKMKFKRTLHYTNDDLT